MTPNSLAEQLTKYLTDAHSIEQQALAQLKTAPGISHDPQIARAFEDHLHETEKHEHFVRKRLEARDARPSTIKDLVGTITGKGFIAFARSQPDTPGKLVAHAYSYEHMEEACYLFLVRVAERAGDEESAEVARRILEQEEAMGHRLESLFGTAVQAALEQLSPSDLGEQLDSYLTDAHAIESQAVQLLRSPQLAGAPQLANVYEEHLAETEQQQRLIADRLAARGASPNKLKDAALRLGALNWGLFFAAQPDTPAKLAGFSYAFEHLEIAAYELLSRVAARAEDRETEAVAQRILAEERTAAQRIHSLFDVALDESLSAQGVAA